MRSLVRLSQPKGIFSRCTVVKYLRFHLIHPVGFFCIRLIEHPFIGWSVTPIPNSCNAAKLHTRHQLRTPSRVSVDTFRKISTSSQTTVFSSSDTDKRESTATIVKAVIPSTIDLLRRQSTESKVDIHGRGQVRRYLVKVQRMKINNASVSVNESLNAARVARKSISNSDHARYCRFAIC